MLLGTFRQHDQVCQWLRRNWGFICIHRRGNLATCTSTSMYTSQVISHKLALRNSVQYVSLSRALSMRLWLRSG